MREGYSHPHGMRTFPTQESPYFGSQIPFSKICPPKYPPGNTQTPYPGTDSIIPIVFSLYKLPNTKKPALFLRAGPYIKNPILLTKFRNILASPPQKNPKFKSTV